MANHMSRTRLRPLERAIETTLAGLVIYGLIVVLLVAGLLLPPVSLGERLLAWDYERVSAQEGKVITLEDGAQLTIPPEGVQGRTYDRTARKLSRTTLSAITAAVLAGTWRPTVG